LKPAFFAYFLCGGKEVSAAPHRGEANRPIRMEGKANALIKPLNQKTEEKPKPKPE
jgi:hypothetical protein